MSERLNNYETVFIVSCELPEDEIKAVTEKFISLIGANGTITKSDEWGKRRLSYPIDDMNDGYYVLINFSAPPSFIVELERIYKITDGLIRSMVIKL